MISDILKEEIHMLTFAQKLKKNLSVLIEMLKIKILKNLLDTLTIYKNKRKPELKQREELNLRFPNIHF